MEAINSVIECTRCRKEVVAGEKFVEISHFSGSSKAEADKNSVMHETCYQLATRSPDLDLQELAAQTMGS
jgi:hypothetical protein